MNERRHTRYDNCSPGGSDSDDRSCVLPVPSLANIPWMAIQKIPNTQSAKDQCAENYTYHCFELSIARGANRLIAMLKCRIVLYDVGLKVDFGAGHLTKVSNIST